MSCIVAAILEHTFKCLNSVELGLSEHQPPFETETNFLGVTFFQLVMFRIVFLHFGVQSHEVSWSWVFYNCEIDHVSNLLCGSNGTVPCLFKLTFFFLVILGVDLLIFIVVMMNLFILILEFFFFLYLIVLDLILLFFMERD